MKFLKVSDKTHEDLKEYCKDKKFFMKDWVDYVVSENIKNNLVNMNEEFIEKLKSFMTIRNIEGVDALSMYVDFNYEVKPKKNKRDDLIFKISGDNISEIGRYLDKNGYQKYYNLVGYNNVTDINIEPENKEGVIQFLSTSRIDGSPMFRAFRNTMEFKDSMKYFDTATNTFKAVDDNNNYQTISENFEKMPSNELEIGGVKNVKAELVSSMEDHLKTNDIIEYSSNTMMSRDMNMSASNIMSPSVSTKQVKIKKRTGDFIQKDIILEFLKKSEELANDRSNCEDYIPMSIDLSVDNGVETEEENLRFLQRRLITKILSASNMIAVEGRIGQAHNVIIPTEYRYLIDEDSIPKFGNKELFKTDFLEEIGMIKGMKFYESNYVDDIIVYRNNNADQPGIVGHYSFDDCSLEEINFDFTDIGFYPNKQFYKITVLDKVNLVIPSKKIENTLSQFEFINIDNEALPYGLGTCEVSSAIKRDECSSSKLQKVLLNEAQQTIMKEMVCKLFDSCENIVDFDVESYLTPLSNETSQSLQRKLIVSLDVMSDGFIIVNGMMGSVLTDSGHYDRTSVVTINSAGMLYPMGKIGKCSIYVDPYMKYNDNRILLFDNSVNISYNKHLIKSIDFVSEATFSPRMLLKLKYKIELNEDINLKIINVIDEMNYLA